MGGAILKLLGLHTAGTKTSTHLTRVYLNHLHEAAHSIRIQILTWDRDTDDGRFYFSAWGQRFSTAGESWTRGLLNGSLHSHLSSTRGSFNHNDQMIIVSRNELPLWCLWFNKGTWSVGSGIMKFLTKSSLLLMWSPSLGFGTWSSGFWKFQALLVFHYNLAGMPTGEVMHAEVKGICQVDIYSVLFVEWSCCHAMFYNIQERLCNIRGGSWITLDPMTSRGV